MGPVSHTSSDDRLHIILRVDELLAISPASMVHRSVSGEPKDHLLLIEAYKWLDIELEVALRYTQNGNGSTPFVQFEPLTGEMPEKFRVLLIVNGDPPREGTIDGHLVRFDDIQIQGDFEKLEVIFEIIEDTKQNQIA